MTFPCFYFSEVINLMFNKKETRLKRKSHLCLVQEFRGAFSQGLLSSQALFRFMVRKAARLTEQCHSSLSEAVGLQVQHAARPFSNIVHSCAHQSVAAINISRLKQNSEIQGIREDENVSRWLVHNAQFSSTAS